MKNNPLIKRPKRGKYISLEGISGTGKSYYINKLKESVDFVSISDLPDNNTNYIKSVFKILESETDHFFSKTPPIAVAMLIFSTHVYNTETEISSALEQGKIVIEDRGVDSIALYQSVLYHWEDFDENKINITYNQLLKFMKEITYIPDRTYVFSGDFEESVRKSEERNNEKYSDFEIEILRRAHKTYRNIRDGDRIVYINNLDDILSLITDFVGDKDGN